MQSTMPPVVEQRSRLSSWCSKDASDHFVIFLTVADTKIVTSTLDGLEKILKVGEQEMLLTGQPNQMAAYISQLEGLNNFEMLQQHEHNDIYENCIKILETYFSVEE